jgi:hypothetical protein
MRPSDTVRPCPQDRLRQTHVRCRRSTVIGDDEKEVPAEMSTGRIDDQQPMRGRSGQGYPEKNTTLNEEHPRTWFGWHDPPTHDDYTWMTSNGVGGQRSIRRPCSSARGRTFTWARNDGIAEEPGRPVSQEADHLERI